MAIGPDGNVIIQHKIDRLKKWADRNLGSSEKRTSKSCTFGRTLWGRMCGIVRNNSTSLYAGGHPAGKHLVRKGPGNPDGHQVGHEPMTCSSWQRRLPVSWFALSKVLSAGWQRCSFSSIQHWWCHTWNAWPSSGLPATGELWSYSKESSKGPLR